MARARVGGGEREGTERGDGGVPPGANRFPAALKRSPVPDPWNGVGFHLWQITPDPGLTSIQHTAQTHVLTHTCQTGHQMLVSCPWWHPSATNL